LIVSSVTPGAGPVIAEKSAVVSAVASPGVVVLAAPLSSSPDVHAASIAATATPSATLPKNLLGFIELPPGC
jgi:hypothetical protein